MSSNGGKNIQEDRKERLAAELRANLKRRKAKSQDPRSSEAKKSDKANSR